ncbi:MAG: DNA polymerase III subunit gamma/tau [Gammaproteobacteria bacterium]|jgi:DNA polymerase-3 subunit gamma/tau|nr:DNA polymerase III subunit gamma/tau [Gammaproteobacteria bacterium]
MSYLVLARKWRPKTFADTVGQEHVLKALVNALDSGRLHHAYLFTGTRGVGKTTIARILAKALNCEKGVSSEPCGECGACREIDEGRFVDLIEVDAASKTKVDDTRDLLDNVQYAPSRGRYKVYLIDEVHMLSTSSFNALLKTLEEPPPHVKFLLATTDPHKLPVTVLSRCLQFNLKRLTPKLIQDRLAHICDAEGIEAETAALAMLARAADGSLRDALSLLDQAIAYCGGKVDEESLALMLGTIDRDHVVRLLGHLAAEDAAAIIDLIAELDEHFPDYARLLEDLARMLQRVAVYQLVGSADTVDEIGESVLSEFAGLFEPADVQLFYQTALMGRRDLPLAPDARSGAEMTLLRMLAFKPAAQNAASGGSGGSAVKPAEKMPRAAPSTPKPAAAAAKAPDAAAQSWRDPDWGALMSDLGLTGSLRLLAGNCALDRREGSTVYFSLDPRSESLLTRHRKDALGAALSKHFGEELVVDIRIAKATPETPHERENRIADARIDAARKSLESDPNVQKLKNMFGAELKTDSIEPLDSSRSD